MNAAVYAFAAVGAFCTTCTLIIAAAIICDGLTDRWRRRHTPTPADIARPYIAQARADLQDAGLMQSDWNREDRFALLDAHIDPYQLASRPYDHQREGL